MNRRIELDLGTELDLAAGPDILCQARRGVLIAVSALRAIGVRCRHAGPEIKWLLFGAEFQ
ncbi:MAG: hypothetical protein ACRD20_02275 [Terriglobales bacterium]